MNSWTSLCDQITLVTITLQYHFSITSVSLQYHFSITSEQRLYSTMSLMLFTCGITSLHCCNKVSNRVHTPRCKVWHYNYILIVSVALIGTFTVHVYLCQNCKKQRDYRFTCFCCSICLSRSAFIPLELSFTTYKTKETYKDEWFQFILPSWAKRNTSISPFLYPFLLF